MRQVQGTDDRAAGRAAQWLRIPRPRPRARARLVCFPHAGGTARFFSTWLTALPPSVELVAAQYPGREDRLAEPAVEDMELLAGPLAEALEELPALPSAFFGHSMGAVVAFEVARALRARGGRRLRHLFVSACAEPSGRGESAVPPTDEEVYDLLRRFGGTDTLVLDSDAGRDAVLPAARADFRLTAGYRPVPGAVVDCPVTAVVGDQDPSATPQAAEGWERRTTGSFTMATMPGGHFYLLEGRGGLVARVLLSLGVRAVGNGTDGAAPLP